MNAVRGQGIVDALGRMRIRPVDAWMLDNRAYALRIVEQILNFPSFALPDLENPVAICGIVHAFGVGEIWMVTGEGFEEQVKTILPMHREMIRGMAQALNLHRVHMIVDPSHPGAARYGKALGFESEFGKLSRRLGPRGEDLEFLIWNEGNS